MPTDPVYPKSTSHTPPPPLPIDQYFEVLSGLTELNSYQAQDVLQSTVQNPPASIPLSGFEHDFTSDAHLPPTPRSPDGPTLRSDDYFVSIGDWPRRLLHVPTMSALEWQPGNLYGTHIAPAYNAISYTWGRYDLDLPQAKKQKQYRKVKAIEIANVARIPRINPTHFTVEQFQRLIRQTCEPIDDDTGEKINFLWLDVACIDQNDGPQKSAEIGRQAGIFRGAHRVFIWLTKIHQDRLSKIVADLIYSTNAAVAYAEKKPQHSQHSHRAEALMDWLLIARASLDAMFIDPWFTSLWTLQEAFLCQNAYIMPLEGTLTPISTGSGLKIGTRATLETLCTLSTLINEVIESERPIAQAQWQADRTDPGVCTRLEDVCTMLTQRGILALATRNPIALYNIAQYRRTTNDQDRVYGIQQIFGFRLGTSAPGCSELGSKFFNRFTLEDQLGAAILVKHPVASQLHNFTEPVEEGRGWRVGGSSIVRSLDILCSVWTPEFERRCELVTEKISGQRWGCFRGQTCEFASLSRVWESVHEATLTFKVLGSKSPQQIMLDKFLREIKDETLNYCPEEPIWTVVWSKGREIPRDRQQHRLAKTLAELVHRVFGGEPLLVLLLGSFIDATQSEKAVNEAVRYHVGLIIVHIKTTDTGRTYWKRLGFCIWQYEYSECVLEKRIPPSQLALMRGDTHCVSWRHESGLFG